MSRADELRALLARVEGATRGDRDLEAELFDTLGCTTVYRTNYADWYCRWPGEQGEYRLMPAPLSCVDHALALINRVLPDAYRFTEFDPRLVPGMGFYAALRVLRLPGNGEVMLKAEAHGHTEPLALIAALLSALIAKEESHAG